MALTPWVREHLQKHNRPADERSDTDTSPGVPNVLSGNTAGEALFPVPKGPIKEGTQDFITQLLNKIIFTLYLGTLKSSPLS